MTFLNSPQNRAHTGFTLTELLVVIAIVIALAALGFGLGGKAVTAAKAATTTSNLRQISSVLHDLREEGVHTGGQTPPGCFPPYSGQISAPSKWRKFTIYDLIAEKAGFCEFKDNRYRWTIHPSKTFLNNPLSEFDLGYTASSNSDVSLSYQKNGAYGGFGYNARIEGWVAAHTDKGEVKQTRISDIPYPERTILMAEQNTDTNKIFLGWVKSSPKGDYKESAHCLFVDGHVELLRNDYLATAEAVNKHLNISSDF